MKRTNRIVLLLGCAFILALELPATVQDLAESWRGPYATGKPSMPGSAGLRPGLSPEGSQLAQR